MAMPQSQISNSSDAHVNTTDPMTEVVPTFRSEEDNIERELDITTLTESSADSLRINDPFMYYSIFKPTGNHAGEVSNLLSMLESNESERRSANVMVTRKTRISVECDFCSALLELMEDTPTIDGRDSENQHLRMIGNDDEFDDVYLSEQP
ncbi:hypothetical protein ACHAW6_001495 [Cyclotella cf. meneghiniana]